MPIQVNIPDDALAGFGNPAQTRLQQATQAYVTSIIQEANRIEAANNGGNAPPEVTHAMVDAAVVLHRHAAAIPKTKLGTKLLRAAGSALFFIVGLMANLTNLQDKFYLLIFIVLLAVTFFINSIAFFKE